MDSSKRERHLDQEHNVDEVNDRISRLPDCILHHILLCLSIKEVVATSVLSKRWKYLWTSIPILDFDDSTTETDIWYLHDVMHFMNIVDRVFRMRDEHSSLYKFRLSSVICFSATHVYDWITAAIEHNVEVLHLDFYVEQPFMLPTCVFYNPKITVLKLQMSGVLHLPLNVSLPSLTTLHLVRVTFPSDNLMQNLFSSCPSLTELALFYCDWSKLRIISITMPSLKILAIHDISLGTLDNLEGCKINIDAGSLRLFTYTGNLQNEINIQDISSEVVASLHIPIFPIRGGQQETADRTVKLFRGLKNICCLRVSADAIKYLFLVDNILPTFRNLKNLELKGKFRKRSTELIIKFLPCFPKLEFLCVAKGLKQSGEDGMLIVGCNHVLSSLKIVNYHNLRGTDIEICFLRFLLQNATALEKMNIFWSKSILEEPTKREEISDLLHRLCRDSSRCVLTLTQKR